MQIPEASTNIAAVMSSATRIWQALMLSFAMLLPAFVLPNRNLTNAAFALLCVAGAVWVMLRLKDKDQRFIHTLVSARVPLIAMTLLPLAILMSQLLHSQLPHVPYLYVRFALCALLVAALLILPSRWLVLSIWGYLLGAIVAAFVAYQATHAGRPGDIAGMNPIPYGNLCLVLAITTLLCWPLLIQEKKRSTVLLAALACLAAVAAIAGLLGSYWTQSRGGWLALVVVVPLLIFMSRQLKWLHKGMVLMLFIAALMASYAFSTSIQQRINLAATELQNYQNATAVDTSVGVRLQLWKVSAMELLAHPLAGVGLKEYKSELASLNASGVITKQAAEMPHSHNELAFFGMTLGVPGLLAVLTMYFAPAWWFYRRIRHGDAVIRTTAFAGLACCLLFFVFGWTEVMFIIAATNALYTFSMALFISLILRRESEIQAELS